MLSFDVVPAFTCDVRVPIQSFHPVRRTAIYEDGQRLLPSVCCGHLYPYDQIVSDCGWCPVRWSSAYAADPVFHEQPF